MDSGTGRSVEGPEDRVPEDRPERKRHPRRRPEDGEDDDDDEGNDRRVPPPPDVRRDDRELHPDHPDPRRMDEETCRDVDGRSEKDEDRVPWRDPRQDPDSTAAPEYPQGDPEPRRTENRTGPDRDGDHRYRRPPSTHAVVPGAHAAPYRAETNAQDDADSGYRKARDVPTPRHPLAPDKRDMGFWLFLPKASADGQGPGAAALGAWWVVGNRDNRSQTQDTFPTLTADRARSVPNRRVNGGTR